MSAPPKEPREVIADTFPTFAGCYRNPEAIRLPSRSDLRVAADAIIQALNDAGYRLVQK